MPTLRLLLLTTLTTWTLAAVALDAWGRAGVPEGRYDAIIVAGCRVYPDGNPSPPLQHRAALAVELWKAGVAPKVVFTGGLDDDVRAAWGDEGPTEAAAAARWARDRGLPAAAVVLEERSTSTEENAAFAAKLVRGERVVVVTDAYHTFRARRVFDRYFGEVTAVGSTYGRWTRIRGAYREVPAIVSYALRGRL